MSDHLTIEIPGWVHGAADGRFAITMLVVVIIVITMPLWWWGASVGRSALNALIVALRRRLRSLRPR